MCNRPSSFFYRTGTSLQVSLIGGGESFQIQITFNSFYDIPPHEPPLHASSSPIPGIRLWPIGGFHMTSLKFKLENYLSSRDFTFMMYESS